MKNLPRLLGGPTKKGKKRGKKRRGRKPNCTQMPGNINRDRIWVIIGCLCWLFGCAYYSTSSGLIGGIRSVAIPVAENETSEFGIAELMTERIDDAFTRDGQLRVIDEESADAVLFLRIIALDDAPFTYTASEETQQYRFKVLTDVELQKTEEGDQLLQLDNLEGWGIYDASLADEVGRDKAVEAALDMIIEEIIDRTTASW